eukprot:3965143-Pyramimonas_sp.AAC.1
MVSAYFGDSEGLSQRNRTILASIGSCAHGFGDSWLVGADFNMSPSALQSSNFFERTAANIISPSSCTFHGGRGASSIIDFFMLSPGLSKCVQKIEVRTDSDVKSHSPVRLTFHESPAELQALSFMKPPKIPIEQPIGPPAETRSADQVLALAQGGLAALRVNPKRRQVQKHLNKLYQEWADLAEHEVAVSRFVTLPRYGARGKVPKLIWVSVADLDSARSNIKDPDLYAFRWLVREFRAFLGELQHSRALGVHGQALLTPPATVADHLNACQDDFLRVGAFLIEGEIEVSWDVDVGWELLSELETSLGKFSAAARDRSFKDWQAWLLDGITKGGRRAHGWTKECKPWTPTTTLSKHGHL